MSEDHSWPRTSSCSGDMHTFIWAGSGKMPDGIPCSCGAIRSGINNVTKDDDLTALRAENERLKTELKTEKLVWAVKEDQMRDNFQKCKDVAEHWKFQSTRPRGARLFTANLFQIFNLLLLLRDVAFFSTIFLFNFQRASRITFQINSV